MSWSYNNNNNQPNRPPNHIQQSQNIGYDDDSHGYHLASNKLQPLHLEQQQQQQQQQQPQPQQQQQFIYHFGNSPNQQQHNLNHHDSIINNENVGFMPILPPVQNISPITTTTTTNPYIYRNNNNNNINPQLPPLSINFQQNKPISNHLSPIQQYHNNQHQHQAHQPISIPSPPSQHHILSYPVEHIYQHSPQQHFNSNIQQHPLPPPQPYFLEPRTIQSSSENQFKVPVHLPSINTQSNYIYKTSTTPSNIPNSNNGSSGHTYLSPPSTQSSSNSSIKKSLLNHSNSISPNNNAYYAGSSNFSSSFSENSIPKYTYISENGNGLEPISNLFQNVKQQQQQQQHTSPTFSGLQHIHIESNSPNNEFSILTIPSPQHHQSVLINNNNTSPTPITPSIPISKTTIRGSKQKQKQQEQNKITAENLKNSQMVLKNQMAPNEYSMILNTIGPIGDINDSEFPEIKGKFRILEKIGQGTFSGVYKSVCISGQFSNCVVALKRVSPTSSPARIMNEINSLMKVGGHHNVSALLGVLRYKDQVTLILPYFEHDSFKDYFFQMSITSFRHYLFALFTSLKHIHFHNICHRDVKPTNFLYNQKSNSFMLIDFGLAQEMLPEQEEELKKSTNIRGDKKSTTTTTKQNVVNNNNGSVNNSNLNNNNNNNGTQDLKPQQAPRAGTRGFRAPEVLLKYNKQTTAIDIWSVGVIILCIISGRYPFFISPDDLTSLAEIISIIGTNKIVEVAASLEKTIHVSHHIPATTWRDLSHRLRNESSENKETIPDEIYDLLDKCLDPNPFTRITASEALHHPFMLPLTNQQYHHHSTTPVNILRSEK